MTKSTLIIILVLTSISVHAQNGQKFDYPAFGITIQTPANLMAQESEEAIIMYSNSMSQTLFLLSMHEYRTLDELKEAAKEPYVEDNSTRLNLEGSIENITDDAVAGIFKGIAGGAPAEAYIIGKINPYGSGVSIIAVSTNNSTSIEVLKEYAHNINSGISFSEKEDGGVIEEYKNRIVNSRLEYRSNYSSPSYTDGGISGYSSSSEVIDICGQGYFIFNGSSSLSIDSGDLSVSGSGNSSSGGNGTWKVDIDVNGNPLLILNYLNGAVENYSLYYEGGYLYMNDYKYTIGRGSEYGPACY